MLRSRPLRHKERPTHERRTPSVTPGAFRLPAKVSGEVVGWPKEEIIRSEPYLRAVAQLPCRACGLEGFSQAAHVPPDGKGIKQSDLETFPLCATRPGVRGCHQEFDQYRMYPDSQEARRVGRRWAEETRGLLQARGMFCKLLGA